MESLNDPEHRQEAAKTIRALVSEIVLTPNEDASALIVDMKGDLAAILSVADARSKKAMPKAADQMETSERKEIEQVETLVVSSVSDCEPCLQPSKEMMVAGARVEHSLGQTKNSTESLANSCKGIMVAGGRFGRLSPDNDVREALVAGACNHRLSLIAEYDVPYRLKA